MRSRAQRQRYIASEHAHRASRKDTTRQHTGDNGWLRSEIWSDFDDEDGLKSEQNAEHGWIPFKAECPSPPCRVGL